MFLSLLPRVFLGEPASAKALGKLKRLPGPPTLYSLGRSGARCFGGPGAGELPLRGAVAWVVYFKELTCASRLQSAGQGPTDAQWAHF